MTDKAPEADNAVSRKRHKQLPTSTTPSAEELDAHSNRRSRNILLFSDGTGNSSGKLQKTNVWRLYEALDLGYPARTGQSVQLAYYDDGVGNSAFKLFAILGGVFGFGLSRNIRDIYKFLCRNFRSEELNSDGLPDRIYAFGFSRGAYTIRLLVSVVPAMGRAPHCAAIRFGQGAGARRCRFPRRHAPRA